MEYEILVRKRGDNDYAAYCPQLDLVVRGTAHEEVEKKMRVVIEQYKHDHPTPPPTPKP